MHKKFVSHCDKLLEKIGLHSKNKADPVHGFRNDDIANVSTKLVLFTKKLIYLVLKVNGGHINNC